MSYKSLLNKCRLCLKSDKELNMHYFFSTNINESSLATLFTNITFITVPQNDYFPQRICTGCKKNIKSFDQMLKIFQETEIYLNSLLSKKEILDDNVDFGFNDNKQQILTALDCNDGTESSGIENNDEYFDIDVIKRELNAVNTSDNTYFKTDDVKRINLENANIPKIELHRRKTNPVESTGHLEYNYSSSLKYTCDCGDCFLHKSGFRQHMQSRHGVLLEDGDFDKYSEEIQLKIPLGFPNNVEFVSSKVIVRKKNLRCRICDISFLTEKEVKSHEEVHKTYICDHCGAAFLKKNYLSDHLRIHSEERRYICKICQKTFKHRYTYGVHKRSHDITRNFVCETCGASFKTRGTMRTHIRIKHSNVRNYPCPNCNLRFNLKSTLDKHFMRKHTPDRKKNFVCSKCGAAYLNKNTLTRHVGEKHLGMAKYFPCTICENKMYVMKKGLKAHMLKEHGIICNI